MGLMWAAHYGSETVSETDVVVDSIGALTQDVAVVDVHVRIDL